MSKIHYLSSKTLKLKYRKLRNESKNEFLVAAVLNLDCFVIAVAIIVATKQPNLGLLLQNY